MEGFVYDTVIIGGGPAGYTAALYCTRAGLSTLVLEKFSAGGQMTETQSIENYPGFDESVDGFTLGFKMQAGAEKYGARTVNAEVRAVFLAESPKRILTAKEEYLAKTVVIATGASHKHLGVAREEALIGKGIGYCAACDGMLYRGKTVAVVGGGNSAAADALYLSRICKKVYLIHRRDKLRAAKVHSDALGRTETVEFKWNTRVAALHGEDTLTSVTLAFGDCSMEMSITFHLNCGIRFGSMPSSTDVADAVQSLMAFSRTQKGSMSPSMKTFPRKS